MGPRRRGFPPAFILAFCVVLNSRLLAQSHVDQTHQSSFGVAIGISLCLTRTLSFGRIVPGSGIHTVGLMDTSAAKLTISGRWNSTVCVAIAPPAELANGGYTLSYSGGAACNNFSDDPAAATLWDSPEEVKSCFRLHADRIGQTARAFIYLFGSISVGALPPGVYSGTYVVSVSY
jgi:hypothetical protein